SGTARRKVTVAALIRHRHREWSFRRPFLVGAPRRFAEAASVLGPICFGWPRRSRFPDLLRPPTEAKRAVGPVAGGSPGLAQPLFQTFLQGGRVLLFRRGGPGILRYRGDRPKLPAQGGNRPDNSVSAHA